MGQVLAVEAVDDAGMPKSWAPTDVGAGNLDLPLLYETTTTEEVRWIDTGDAFEAKTMLIVELTSVATTTNESDYAGACSARPYDSGAETPYGNSALAQAISGMLPKQYNKYVKIIAFRGESGVWVPFQGVTNAVNLTAVTAQLNMRQYRKNITGICIGDSSAASGTRVFGVGTTLRIWGA